MSADGRLSRMREGAGDLAWRVRPGSRLPASKRRGLQSDALQSSKPAGADADLVERRDELSRKLAGLQFDLGGLAYEMASREHFRLDVIMRAAADLQQVDAELGQVERLLAMDATGAAGSCAACGALQARGAVFCWQCGIEMTPEGTPPELAQAAALTTAVPQPVAPPAAPPASGVTSTAHTPGRNP